MKISQNGIDLIKKYEGCRLKAYLCPSNVWTIGYGHVIGVTEGMTITQQQAEDFLREDLERYERYVSNNVPFDMTQDMFDALVSFTYNCGAGNLKTLIKDRTAEQVADAILLYNKGGGVVLQGLVKRRKDEQALFLKGMGKGGENGLIEAQEGIVEYSLSKDGNNYVSKNFKVREFACKDGSDKILIDIDFVKNKLQKIRDHFGKPITINSAYRHAAYNDRVGGADNSYHVKGQAFDIVVKDVKPIEVARYAESIDIPGIIKYDSFVHVDSRENRFWAVNQSGRLVPVVTFEENHVKPVLKMGSKGKDVSYLQSFLKDKGAYHGSVDGIFGAVTKQAVIEWQGYCEIVKDGIVGKATWATIG